MVMTIEPFRGMGDGSRQGIAVAAVGVGAGGRKLLWGESNSLTAGAGGGELW
jgi:hypothetical protein